MSHTNGLNTKARGAIRQNTKAGNITSSLHLWQDTALLSQVPRGEPKAGDFVEKHFVEFGQFRRKGQQLWVVRFSVHLVSEMATS